MKCLVVVDIQNDFCPGGALAVDGGDSVVPGINAMMPDYDLVVLTQDWHPAGHSSFASSHGAEPFSRMDMPYGEQVLWPDHCVAGSDGAAFHPGLDTDQASLVLRKGSNPKVDSYSAFFENDRTTRTGLAGYLRGRGCMGFTIVGLATDYCVAWSAFDAVAEGFDVEVDLSVCRGIDLDNSLAESIAAMRDAGVSLVGG